MKTISKYIYTPFLVGGLLLTSCQKEEIHLPEGSVNSPEKSEEVEKPKTPEALSFASAVPGRLLIKVKPEALRTFQQSSLNELRSASTTMGHALREIQVKSIRPYFQTHERFKARHKAAGLDRWLVVTFEETTSPEHAVTTLAQLPELEYVEAEYRISKPKTSIKPLSASELRTLSTSRATDTEMPTNDPLLPKQWHYHNMGNLDPLSRAGADINLFEAWVVTKGTPNVVVCVVDGGVDPKHEDLQGTLDVANSFNFVYDRKGEFHGQGKIYPDSDGHGTHVAGTIAAVNNNSLGVSGIAGGDGNPNTGVKILSAQVYGLTGEDSAGGAAAIVWGADNGAVISQNSWGYTYPGPKHLPRIDKEAIDYFIANAGMDENGQQREDSPMAGGIVIFAAGNDGMDYVCWPGAYEACVSVSAMAWDFSVAAYSNRGDWVSIMAPGGDQIRFSNQAGVLSTLPKDGKISETGYGYMQGTSMACPHVSGVAALILSAQGRRGYTAEQLRQQLLTSLRPYDINLLNPSYRGRLGVGYIDAGAALESDGGKAPHSVESIEAKPHYNDITLRWGTAKDEDAPLGIARYYHLYVSEQQLTSEQLAKQEPILVYGQALALGKQLEHKVQGLKDDTGYHLAIVAVDRFGHRSTPRFLESKTLLNNAPQITAGLPERRITLPRNKAQRLVLEVEDKDGHEWTLKKSGQLRGVNIHRQGSDKILVEINPVATEGVYSFTLTLSDSYGKTSEYPITYELVKYQKPRFNDDLRTMMIGVQEKDLRLSLLDKIATLTEGLSPKFAVEVDDPSILKAHIDENNSLVLNPLKEGRSVLTLTLNDGIDSTSIKLEVYVVKEPRAIVHALYPIPAKTYLNLLFNAQVREAQISVSTLRGERLIHQQVRPARNGIGVLDVRKLVPGTYVLSVKSQQGHYQTTFLKH